MANTQFEFNVSFTLDQENITTVLVRATLHDIDQLGQLFDTLDPSKKHDIQIVPVSPDFTGWSF